MIIIQIIAPALVVGGLIVVNLSYANLSYLATMNIRSDFKYALLLLL